MNEYLFKFIVIGEANVGKASIIKRYVSGEFSNKYKYTIGVDFALKQIEWEKNTIVRLQLWDIAGQERFGVMTRVYYKEATAACIVFDISNRRSFQAVPKWKKDVDAQVHLPNGMPVPTILLANKCDLNPAVTNEELDKFIREHGFLAWFETSAKENQNIDKAMTVIVQHIITLIHDEWTSDLKPTEPGSFKLTTNPKKKQESSGCCGLSTINNTN